MMMDKLRMNLQYFAADDNKPEGSGGADAGETKPDKEDATVTVAEMQRRLAKEQERAAAQIAEIESSFEDKMAEAIDKARKEAELTGKELDEYKQQEAQRKYDELVAENERLKQEQVKRQLRDEAINTLNEKKMPVNDAVLSFVVRDTAKDTLAAIDAMAELLNEQKEAYAQSDAPITSGGINKKAKAKTPFEILDEAKITDF